jgi:hypothetical protein
MIEERRVFVETWCMTITGPSIAASGLGGGGYLGCLGMVQVGYVEAARRAAQRNFLPGGEGSDFAPEALYLTQRPASALALLLEEMRAHFVPLYVPRPLAAEWASLVRAFRKRIFADSCAEADTT